MSLNDQLKKNAKGCNAGVLNGEMEDASTSGWKQTVLGVFFHPNLTQGLCQQQGCQKHIHHKPLALLWQEILSSEVEVADGGQEGLDYWE